MPQKPKPYKRYDFNATLALSSKIERRAEALGLSTAETIRFLLAEQLHATRERVRIVEDKQAALEGFKALAENPDALRPERALEDTTYIPPVTKK